MEIKINKEIREYTENMFFGLSFRQFFFSLFAALGTIIVYVLLKSKLGIEITSWLCILIAVPPILFGFIKYNGMPMERFIIAWLKSEILIPKKLVFKSKNFYYELLKEKIEKNLV